MRKFTVGTVKKWAFHRALEYGYLLAERQVLCGECGAALEQQPEKDRDEL